MAKKRTTRSQGRVRPKTCRQASVTWDMRAAPGAGWRSAGGVAASARPQHPGARPKWMPEAHPAHTWSQSCASGREPSGQPTSHFCRPQSEALSQTLPTAGLSLLSFRHRQPSRGARPRAAPGQGPRGRGSVCSRACHQEAKGPCQLSAVVAQQGAGAPGAGPDLALRFRGAAIRPCCTVSPSVTGPGTHAAPRPSQAGLTGWTHSLQPRASEQLTGWLLARLLRFLPPSVCSGSVGVSSVWPVRAPPTPRPASSLERGGVRRSRAGLWRPDPRRPCQAAQQEGRCRPSRGPGPPGRVSPAWAARRRQGALTETGGTPGGSRSRSRRPFSLCCVRLPAWFSLSCGFVPPGTPKTSHRLDQAVQGHSARLRC